MSVEITTAHVEQYKSRVELLLQQKMSRFEMCCDGDTYTGKAATVVEQVGEVDIPEKTVRHADTRVLDIPHDRPWVHPRDFPAASFIDQEDKLRMLANFENPYAEVLTSALRRKKDDLLIQAAVATRLTGENGSDTSPFDTSNHQVVSGSTGLTTAKLIQGLEILAEEENDEDEERYCAIAARQLRDLLNDPQLTSSDYATVKALVEGKVDTWLGFKFIRTQRLGTVTGERGVLCWVKSGLHLGKWRDIQVRIGERPDKDYLMQVWVAMTCGATRTQEGKVVRILCTES